MGIIDTGYEDDQDISALDEWNARHRGEEYVPRWFSFVPFIEIASHAVNMQLEQISTVRKVWKDK